MDGNWQFCLVGCNRFNTFGSHGAADFISFKHFASLQECCSHLKNVEGCQIVGIEITPEARSVNEHPFHGPTAFMLGNEGTGMSDKQRSLCDQFVYIPQYGCGTASLNVTVAAAIVLHRFTEWAGYEERRRVGEKFELGDRPRRTAPRGVVADPGCDVHRDREIRREDDQDVLMESGDGAGSEGGFLDGILGGDGP
eukprot:evm.model.scf_1028.3 EVM.evm.TU.scf_1028.3   scf_1028:11389-14333(+)